MSKVFKLVLIIVVVIGFSSFMYNREINNSAAKIGDETIFIVNSGETVKKIGANLLDASLIKSDFYFKIYVWHEELDGSLQAGEYALKSTMTIKEIVKILVSGESLSREREIKIIEGWDISEIDTYLSKQGISEKDEFSRLANADAQGWKSQAGNLDIWSGIPLSASLEGYLFPDTYRIFRDAAPNDIVIKMLENLDRKINPKMRAEMKNQGKTIFDIITMASIIEKEVRGAVDMKIVSGILYKRLEIGMKLEVDSTINYLTGKNNPGSTFADLKIDSPYNTYMYYGLPPGPIANPGFNAIYAAIYPEKSPYLFYLNRQDTGETIFSKTYEEHLRNKAKYLD